MDSAYGIKQIRSDPTYKSVDSLSFLWSRIPTGLLSQGEVEVMGGKESSDAQNQAQKGEDIHDLQTMEASSILWLVMGRHLLDLY